MYVAKAYDVASRSEVDIKALGTGQEEQPHGRRMKGVPISYEDC